MNVDTLNLVVEGLTHILRLHQDCLSELQSLVPHSVEVGRILIFSQ